MIYSVLFAILIIAVHSYVYSCDGPSRVQCPDYTFSARDPNTCRFQLCPPTELVMRNGMCLDIDGLQNNNWKRNGAKAQVWKCHPERTHSSNQKFIYDPNQKSFIVGFAQSNFCLDIHGPDYDAKRNGGKVQAWACHPGPNQIFSYDREVHALVSENGDCMDLHGPDYNSRTNGGKIQMWDCHPGPNQDFIALSSGPAYPALSVEQNELGELGTDSNIFAFQLSNQWGIFAAVFGLLLVINIICMTYYWCNGCKKQKHKYDSVKFVDTEDEEMRT